MIFEKVFKEMFAFVANSSWPSLSVWLVNPSHPVFEVAPQLVLLSDRDDLVDLKFDTPEGRADMLNLIRKKAFSEFPENVSKHMVYMFAWEDFRDFLSPWPSLASDPASPLYFMIRGKARCLVSGPEAKIGPIIAEASIGLYKEVGKEVAGWHKLAYKVDDFDIAAAVYEWREAYKGHEPFAVVSSQKELVAWMDSFVENNLAKWMLSITQDSDIEIVSAGLEDGVLLPVFTVADLSSTEPQGVHLFAPRSIYRAPNGDIEVAFVDTATEKLVTRP